VNKPVRELAKVTLNVSFDVSIFERCFDDDRRQRELDARFFSEVVQRLMMREAAQQYAKAITKWRP
jgi:hypothetical protein